MSGKLKKYLIDRIREYFETKEWDYKFQWGKNKELWGDKYESINSLAKALDCPKTSLYIPIHQLVKEGFITFDKIIAYERKLS